MSTIGIKPKSAKWLRTAKRVLAIVAFRKVPFKVFVEEIRGEYFSLYRNVRNGNQPSPEVEAKVEAWCEKFQPKTK